MSESFYTALGVAEDADDGTLKAAYRDAVKRHHPDVNDDPAAHRQFQHLTTARDVLLDSEERARYDRLGHDTYVSRYLNPQTGSSPDDTGRVPSWDEAATGPSDTDDRRSSQSTDTSSRASGVSDQSRSPGGGRSTRDPDPRTGPGPVPGSMRARAATGRYRHVREAGGTSVGQSVGVEEPWQAASKTYQRSATASREAANSTKHTTVRDIVAGLGPWLVVHVVFLVSAVATGAFVLSEASAAVHLSLPAYLLGLVLFGLVVALSVLHLISTAVS